MHGYRRDTVLDYWSLEHNEQKGKLAHLPTAFCLPVAFVALYLTDVTSVQRHLYVSDSLFYQAAPNNTGLPIHQLRTKPPKMSHHHRPSLLQQSATSSSSTHSTTLNARIVQKRAELENLRALRDLSAQLASQFAVLESKLGMLSEGTEGVAEVLRNWRGVLGVLGVVGGELGRVRAGPDGEGDGDGEAERQEAREGDLPGTLVRIPVGEGGEDGESSVKGD